MDLSGRTGIDSEGLPSEQEILPSSIITVATAMYSIQCPLCKHQVRVAEAPLGSTLACSNCTQELQIAQLAPTPTMPRGFARLRLRTPFVLLITGLSILDGTLLFLLFFSR